MMRTAVLAALAITLVGCQVNRYQPGSPQYYQLRETAFECFRRGIEYSELASVRAHAVESLEHAAPQRGLAWIRTALTDTHAGVRFAACVALGSLVDRDSAAALERRLGDDDRSVQVAAVFALHRLGDTGYTHLIPNYLLEDDDPHVRANAALVLGRMGEPAAVRLLARVMAGESDEAVRLQTLESLTLLGNPEATQELVVLAQSDGDRAMYAITALGELRDPRFADLFRQKVSTAMHPETKLAAGRALGYLDSDYGLSTAMKELDHSGSVGSSKADPAWNRRNRIRQLAALALGAIGDLRALPSLAARMTGVEDPRVQVAAGRAILEIIHADEVRAMPFELRVDTRDTP